MDTTAGAQEASMAVQIFGNTAGSWLLGRAAHLQTPAGQDFRNEAGAQGAAGGSEKAPLAAAEARAASRKLEKRRVAADPLEAQAAQLRFELESLRVELDEAKSVFRSPAAHAIIRQAEVDMWRREAAASEARAARLLAGLEEARIQATFAGDWARAAQPGTKVARIAGGTILWQGKERTITTLKVRTAGFSTTDADGNTFKAEFRDGQLIWGDSEVWVPVQPQSSEAAEVARRSSLGVIRDQTPVIGTVCMNGHDLQPFAATNHWCDTCGEGQPPGAEMRSCHSCEYGVCGQCVGKTGHPLLGPWEMIHSGRRFKVVHVDGQLHYNMKECTLREEGRWLSATLDGAGEVRLRVGASGKTLIFQQRLPRAKEWSRSLYGVCPGGLTAGTEILTTGVAELAHSAKAGLPEESAQLGLVPPGTRLVAAGPVEIDGRGNRMLPLLPHGRAVLAKLVRPLEVSGDEDEPTTGGSSSASASATGPASLAAGHGSNSPCYLSLGSLLDALAGGDTVLLRGTWLHQQGEQGAVLPRRQDLPLEAVWDPTELGPLLHSRRVQVVAVSYCWITPDHPDPKGDQLQILGRALGMRLAEETQQLQDLAVFLDWCSLHQKPRRPDQSAAFGRGLKAVNLWYAHAATTVLTMTKLPPECVQYNDRGWPFFERAVSSMLKDSSRLLDLGAQRSPTDWLSLAGQCAQGRRPPLNPAAFAEALKLRTFTNKADHGFVIGKYNETYQQVLRHAPVLEFAKLTWGPEEAKVLATALPDCGALKKLVLTGTPIGVEGARHLATSLPGCLHLRELQFGRTGIGDGGATALAVVFPRCPRLQHLVFQNTGITGEGTARIAEVVPSCPHLEILDFLENSIGRLGVEALLAAIPACRHTALWEIHLTHTGLLEADRHRLKEVWKAAGKLPNKMYF